MLEILHKLADLLSYKPEAPLLFTNGLFLFLFLGFICIYALLKDKTRTRILFVIAFSLYFYYKTSGWYLLLLILVSLSDFLLGRWIARQSRKNLRKWGVTASLLINLGLLGYFKYTNFLLEIFSEFWKAPLDFQTIFLPIGISFFIFQSISYIIDIYRGIITPLHRYQDYLFYISFFPQLVAGPIVRARDFIPQIRQRPVVTHEMFERGIFLIALGLIKKAIISDYLSLNFVDRIFDNPLLYSGFENLMGVYAYALQIYCDFSGYSDMAIGLALLLGFHFRDNFNSPYKSATITEFWRRWHISLSSWLKDYLYIPLGGSRKGRRRTYINLILTMLLGGLWHGAAFRFVLWGGLHGAALAGHKLLLERFPSCKATGGEMTSGWRRALGIFLTFNLVCLGWIYFRASTLEQAHLMLGQIFTQFNPELIGPFVVGYKWVVLLMVVGYAFQFIPQRWEDQIFERITGGALAYKVIGLSALIWFIMQIKSSEIQPFIYFQF